MKNIDKLINRIYNELECSEYIINHSNTVYKRTQEITKHYDNIDKELIKAGAKLHDVGRTVTSSVKHAYIGADLLRELNIDERICKITERHIGAGITPLEAKKLELPPRNYIPETLEEKIVAHADNLVHGIKFVDLDFVIKKWTNKGMSNDSINRLIKLHDELIN
ncbi:TIGR00295 family protein [Methanosphaera sp. WGK6]|uniref:TIGR00295 family protein n=1 Tax=Methanosphaera sp. WGK6 TaxID=1561964 RepID=UPI00084C0602|nr:TIGR00295 family protein [Methanosphaera sp. WGK6]OED30660.1 hypothetical protein NL43_01590 [Methanosphaera sp. WGK6]